MPLTCPNCGNARNFLVKTLQMHVVNLDDTPGRSLRREQARRDRGAVRRVRNGVELRRSGGSHPQGSAPHARRALALAAAFVLLEIITLRTDPFAHRRFDFLRSAGHPRHGFARHEAHELAAHRAFFRRHLRILWQDSSIDQTGRSYGTAPKLPSRSATPSREKHDALPPNTLCTRVFLTTSAVGFYRGCKVFRPRRSDASRVALETLVPHERAYRRSFADEVAIDFPSSRAAIEFFRRDHVEPEGPTQTAHAEIAISASQAGAGAMVSLDVSVPRTCACCGGRGEVWSEPCEPCDGSGQELHRSV